MEKYRDKYRIPSARLQDWDYGWNAAYFITICTKHKTHFWGHIDQGKMHLTTLGKIAKIHWEEIPQRFPYAYLDEFVIMPDHIHGIIAIDKSLMDDDGGPNDAGDRDGRSNAGDRDGRRDAINRVSTAGIDQIDPPPGGITAHNNPMLHDNLSRIIRWYKGRVTYESRKIQPAFAWQPRFYDHIIRDRAAHDRIASYIANNPLNWDEDRFNDYIS